MEDAQGQLNWDRKTSEAHHPLHLQETSMEVIRQLGLELRDRYRKM